MFVSLEFLFVILKVGLSANQSTDVMELQMEAIFFYHKPDLDLFF